MHAENYQLRLAMRLGSSTASLCVQQTNMDSTVKKSNNQHINSGISYHHHTCTTRIPISTSYMYIQTHTLPTVLQCHHHLYWLGCSSSDHSPERKTTAPFKEQVHQVHSRGGVWSFGTHSIIVMGFSHFLEHNRTP